jgi:hypothetical protein
MVTVHHVKVRMKREKVNKQTQIVKLCDLCVFEVNYYQGARSGPCQQFLL